MFPIFLILISLIPCLCTCEEIASESAYYDGNKLILEGDVVIDFKTSSFLKCDVAHLDLIKKEGKVFSIQNPIFYQDQWGNIPIDITGNEMEFDFFEIKSLSELKTLKTHGDVLIHLGTQLSLRADHTLFEKQDKGTLYAHPNQTDGICHLTYLQDEIDAKEMQLDLEKMTIQMKYPDGDVSSYFSTPFHFSAKHLLWNHSAHHLTLEGEIEINKSQVGKMSSKGRMEISQKQEFGKYVFHTLTIDGETDIEFGKQHLTCYGQLKLNRDTLTINATSPLIEQKTPLNQQLKYETLNYTLFANTGLLQYTISGLKLVPKLLILKGNVRIMTGSKLGLSDEIYYYPKENELLLKAKQGHTVLIYDRKKKLYLSAHEIQIKIDPETKEEKIKGIGSTRFTFNQEEASRIKENFQVTQ